MLGFRSKGRFRISKAFDNEHIASNIVNFLAVSNKYGLIFLVNDDCLNILDTSVIRNHIVTKENFKQEQTSFAIKSFDLGCSVERVDCNFDGSLVSIVLKSANAGFALIYDVRCFLSGFNGNALPLCKIHLYINQTAPIQTSCLSCFQWNPGVANVFAVCACDGTISTYQIEDVDKVTVEGVLETSNPKAVCLSWSPKGKQLVVGYDDCSLSQFKPNLHLAKKIDPINAGIAGFQCTIVDICWLSTTHFIVLLSDKKDQYRVSLLHLTLNKEGPPTFKNFEDVCFGISTKFKPHYYISHVLECNKLFWARLSTCSLRKLIICSSTNSMESAVVGYNSDKKDWEIWTMDDEERAELPLNSLENETFPVGVALDLVDSEKDQSPLLLVLSNDGVLCPFQINYKGPHSKDPICKARERNISFSDIKTSKMFAARSSDFFGVVNNLKQSDAPSSVYNFAAFCVGICSYFPDVQPILLAHLYLKCPILIPMYVRTVEKTDAGKKSLETIGSGVDLDDEGRPRLTEQELQPIVAYAQFYAILFVVQPPKGKTSTFEIRSLWNFLQDVVKLTPRFQYTTIVLNQVLKNAGFALFPKYGKLFEGLLKMIRGEFLGEIESVNHGFNVGAFVDLKRYLESADFRKQPEGYLGSSIWIPPPPPSPVYTYR